VAIQVKGVLEVAVQVYIGVMVLKNPYFDQEEYFSNDKPCRTLGTISNLRELPIHNCIVCHLSKGIRKQVA
jgi:hypothetical protein